MMTRLMMASICTVVCSGCSDTQAPAKTRAEPSAALSAKPDAGGESTVKPRQCKTTNLDRSICMAEMILADISTNYGWVSGGGVSEIKQLSGTSYQITLPQEEREDIYTYEFDVAKDGTVSIKSKKESTKSY
jgi:hypothetical protein